MFIQVPKNIRFVWNFQKSVFLKKQPHFKQNPLENKILKAATTELPVKVNKPRKQDNLFKGAHSKVISSSGWHDHELNIMMARPHHHYNELKIIIIKRSSTFYRSQQLAWFPSHPNPFHSIHSFIYLSVCLSCLSI